MTTALETPVAVSDQPPRRRRIWRKAVIGVVVLALIGTGIGWLVFINTYQPLANGGSSGEATRSIQPISDGTTDTRLVIVGPTGTTGVADYVIRNDGGFPVRLLGLDRSQPLLIVTGMKWSDLSADNIGDGTTLGLVSHAKDFPVTLQPNESVFLQVSVSKPTCQGNLGTELTSIPIRWSALGVHHVWDYELTGNELTDLPILACPSKAALAHIENR